MNKKFLFCLSFFALTSLSFADAPALAIAETEVNEMQTVAEIDIFVENLPPGASFDSKAVLSKLKTKVGDPFSQTIFDSDLKALAEQYDYIEPSIEIRESKVFITLKIWLRSSIRNISWKGNHIFKTKKLQKELGIEPHSVFNRQTFNKAFNKVKELYIKKGYFESQLQYQVISVPKTQEVDIEITVKEGRSGRIDEVVLNGFSKEEQSELFDMMYTKKYSLLTSWFTGIGNYNEEMVEQDRQTVYNFLQNKGYADAKVSIEIKESEAKDKIIIEISADKGPLYHFGQVSFEGNILFTDAEIEKVFLARPGGVYSPEKIKDTTQIIKDMYGRKGHIDASVQTESQLAVNKPIYNVHFRIDEGKQFKIGLIRIFGNVNTESRVILRESLLVPGEIFDSAKLRATQQRLENVGYFKSVNVYAVRTQDDLSLGENYRDVYIEVVETQTGSASLFMGASSSDSVFGGLDISENNFNYKGITRIAKKGFSAIRGGGEYLHLRASFGRKQQSYVLSWLTPYFRDTPWRVGFEINDTLSKLQAKHYTTNTFSVSLYAYYPLTQFWTFGTRYRIRDAEVDVGHHVSEQEKKAGHKKGILSGISTSLTFDSTDSALRPHNGLRTVLDGEFVGLGGHYTFLRFFYLNSYYTRLWKGGVMKYHGDYRCIIPIWKSHNPNDIPLTERFFLGGEASVRGYENFALGPHFFKEKHGKLKRQDPKGGIASLLLSVEFQQEIFRLLDGFLFIDAGSVELEKHWQPGTLRLSYGFGFKINISPRTPFVFGWGFPINPAYHKQKQNFFFSFGGQF